jgi:threonine synthase
MAAVASPAGLECIRCGARYPLDHHAQDCARCRAVAPSNLTVRYDDAPLAGLSRAALAGRPATMWRYAEALPVPAGDAVSLGEGMTPLLPAPRLGRALGVERLFLKDESRNPTWSFKDRLASVVVSTARARGVRVIASSSSGNAGAAVAAYAARAGIPCIVFTFQGAAGPMVTQMRAYGALVLAVKEKAERWTLLEAGVRQRGWFPTSPFFAPAVGSNPFGIEGYKTLAYEVVEQLGGRAPDWCVLPVCYGDALYGMDKGFQELRAAGWIATTPRMVAAEIYGSLGAALASGADALPEMPLTHPSLAASIAATRSTFQALRVLRRSGGAARSIGDREMLDWQARLAGLEGVWAEPSAAAAVAAVHRLREDGVMAADATVVALLTAGGLKDPAPAAARLGEAPVVAPRLDAVDEALARAYSVREVLA